MLGLGIVFDVEKPTELSVYVQDVVSLEFGFDNLVGAC